MARSHQSARFSEIVDGNHYTYGAAKGLVERYAQGLKHHFFGSGVSVVLIKPGPTDTAMTRKFANRKIKLAAVENVARQCVLVVNKKKPIAYVPNR